MRIAGRHEHVVPRPAQPRVPTGGAEHGPCRRAPNAHPGAAQRLGATSPPGPSSSGRRRACVRRERRSGSLAQPDGPGRPRGRDHASSPGLDLRSRGRSCGGLGAGSRRVSPLIQVLGRRSPGIGFELLQVWTEPPTDPPVLRGARAFSFRYLGWTMHGPDRCDLHDAALQATAGKPEVFLRWASTPIGEECRRCPVCRTARTYIERGLAERAGRVPPAGESADVAWRQLQSAVAEARSAIRPGR